MHHSPRAALARKFQAHSKLTFTLTSTLCYVSNMSETYTITDLAREFDITTRTIRFYEDKQLLKPTRRGTTRVYDKGDRTRLKLVLRGRRLGWPLNEIRDMIDMYDHSGGELKQLQAMVTRLQQNRETLLAQRNDIEQSLQELDALEDNCLAKLGALANTGPNTRQDVPASTTSSVQNPRSTVAPATSTSLVSGTGT